MRSRHRLIGVRLCHWRLRCLRNLWRTLWSVRVELSSRGIPYTLWHGRRGSISSPLLGNLIGIRSFQVIERSESLFARTLVEFGTVLVEDLVLARSRGEEAYVVNLGPAALGCEERGAADGEVPQ